MSLAIIQMPLIAQATQHGPRTDLQIFYYPSSTALYDALKAGEIDLMYQPLTSNQYLDAIADPKILVAPGERLDLRAWSLNNNETIATYPGVRSALSYVEFRKALWRLSDKVYYRDVIFGGLAVDLPVPIASPSREWWNTSVVNYVNTNLYFSVWEANALLNASGFVYGSTLNPSYNAGVPGSARYIRVYPPGHSFAGQNLNATIFYARRDDVTRLAPSRHLRDRMLESGIPVSLLEKTFSECQTPVAYERNYHIYSSRWSVSRFPSYLYGLFHTSLWIPSTVLAGNIHVSLTSPPYPAMPAEIDAQVEKVWYPTSHADAMKAAKDAQYLLVEKYANMIPLLTRKDNFAYRNLLGVNNMQGTGLENEQTLLNAYRSDDPAKPIRAGQLAPTQVNQIYSSGVYDLSSMNPFMADLMSQAPYSITTDVPRLSQDWSGSPSTWFDGAVEKSKMTYWFRDDPSDGPDDSDAEWIEPVTGNVLADFTPQWLEGGGYEFNTWYYASETSGGIYGYYRDIHHIRIYSAEKKAEVYFNVKTFWYIPGYVWEHGRFLYSPLWKQTPLSTLETRIFVEGINATTPGDLSLPYQTMGAPVEVESLLEDGTRLTKANGLSDNDYEIVLGRVRIYKDIAIGARITVTYWARGDPTGYAPGNLYRTDNPHVGQVWLGAGPFYVTDHVSGVGGRTIYKKNPHFFLETPPLGEIDFQWYWIEGGQPRDGYYTVDAADAAKASYAYGSSGTSAPSSNWEAGCDLALPLGSIDDNDVLMVTGASGMSWGSPPPNPPPPPSMIHDVAVTSITPSREVIPQGSVLNINVTVQNQGESSIVLNVTAYANTTIIDTFINVALTSGNAITLAFAWNTAGLSTGNYTISAYVSLVPGEADIADNILAVGDVLVTIPGDVDGDTDVDASDLIEFSSTYGSTLSNPNCDLNDDERIDALDLFILGKNYGKTS